MRILLAQLAGKTVTVSRGAFGAYEALVDGNVVASQRRLVGTADLAFDLADGPTTRHVKLRILYRRAGQGTTASVYVDDELVFSTWPQ